MRKPINNLLDAKDTDTVQVICSETDNIVAAGNWYQDNILKYLSSDGYPKNGYKFTIKL